LAQRLQERCPGAVVHFLGLRGGLEERLVPREGFPLHTVTARPLKGKSRYAQLGALGALGVGTVQAVRIVRRFHPHLLIGSGGYVMGPAVLAAALLRRPRVLMEQNVRPGMTVRVLARLAQRVFTSFPETAAYLPAARVEYTGTPVRQEICALGVLAAPPDHTSLHVLIVGGSQGAHRLNQAMVEALPLLAAEAPRLRIVHQTGTADLATLQQAYQGTALHAEVQPFLYDMAARYQWAHVVVCRAGASTLAELTVCGKPALLIPYPYAADDHQRHNAEALQAQGAAQVMLDAELTGIRLAAAIRAWLEHPERLHAQAACSRHLGRPQAADAIITACLALLKGASGNEEARRGLQDA
jgi:UDP-N-acetylglucosamine--N-acetylmuramyl-(pentapeptide) pyrophosphoryl-undecaprenol N-acetylglucosamine transferase